MNSPESVVRNVLSLYESGYAAELATVQAEWAGTEDVTLDDFQTRLLTSRPGTLEKHWLLPALSIAVGELKPTAADQEMQQFQNYYDLEIIVTYFLTHADPVKLSLIVMRHMQATLNFLGKNAGVGYAGGSDRVLIETLRMIPSYTATDGNVFKKGLMIPFDFRIVQYGP
ncbi:MAG: hypothetical protein GF334_01235 [Candidatus Altiarchaeales archaeon]|nr:hypothetical protein [Candidatus Altiarchaeales archaeon]